MKNLKLFDADSERTTYEESGSYNEPYASYVIGTNKVWYNETGRQNS